MEITNLNREMPYLLAPRCQWSHRLPALGWCSRCFPQELMSDLFEDPFGIDVNRRDLWPVAVCDLNIFQNGTPFLGPLSERKIRISGWSVISLSFKREPGWRHPFVTGKCWKTQYYLDLQVGEVYIVSQLIGWWFMLQNHSRHMHKSHNDIDIRLIYNGFFRIDLCWNIFIHKILAHG